MFSLFSLLLDLPKREVQILAHGLGNLDLINRIKVLAATRLADNPKLIEAIENAMVAYDSCRQNRNLITHFDIQLALGKERSLNFRLMRRPRKPDPEETSIRFDDSLRSLRRVAKDIWKLNAQLKTIGNAIFAKQKPEAFATWDSVRKERVARLKPVAVPKLLSDTVPPETALFSRDDDNAFITPTND